MALWYSVLKLLPVVPVYYVVATLGPSSSTLTQLPANVLGKAVEEDPTAQASTPMQETRNTYLASGLSLAQIWLFGPSEE